MRCPLGEVHHFAGNDLMRFNPGRTHSLVISRQSFRALMLCYDQLFLTADG